STEDAVRPRRYTARAARAAASRDQLGFGPMEGIDVGLTSLRAMPLFTGVPEHDLQSILKIGEIRSYQPGQAVVERGDVGDSLFIILGGTAGVEVAGDSHDLSKGDFF